MIDIDTTEEFILNPKSLPEPLRNWRAYRIEYGGPNEYCMYEGRILLPPRANPEFLVQLLLGMQQYEEMWKIVPIEEERSQHGLGTNDKQCLPEQSNQE